MALQKLPGDADVVIVFALFQSALPVAPSYAYRSAAVPAPEPVAGRPVDSAKTTPLTVIGVAGVVRLCERHPGSSEKPPLAPSTSFNATTDPAAVAPLVTGTPAARAPDTGARIQRVPSVTVPGTGGAPPAGTPGVIVACCQVASDPASAALPPRIDPDA